MPAPLGPGRIVTVTVRDPQGGNEKRRPAVVVSRTSEIVETGLAVVVAVTSDIGRARSTDAVPLPGHPDGHPLTKLVKPSEVVCSWGEVVRVTDLVDTGGEVPPDRLPDILRKFARLN